MSPWRPSPVMEKPDYCTRESVETCLECSLTSYNRDCMNNPVRYPDDEPEHSGSPST